MKMSSNESETTSAPAGVGKVFHASGGAARTRIRQSSLLSSLNTSYPVGGTKVAAAVGFGNGRRRPPAFPPSPPSAGGEGRGEEGACCFESPSAHSCLAG